MRRNKRAIVPYYDFGRTREIQDTVRIEDSIEMLLKAKKEAIGLY